MRFVLALLMVLTAAPSAAGALAIRPARPADDVAHPDNGWNEEWRVIAFDPRTHGSVAIYFVARPVPLLSVQVRVGAKAASTGAELPYGLLPHPGPGVTIANRPDAAPPQPNSLSYVRGHYVLDFTWPARGHLTIVPRRAGVTVGTWHLGKERVLPANPPRYVPGTMLWSVPVAVGTASGWIEADRTRVTLRGWRAYHDHIWGRYRLASSTWAHSDLAVVSPRPGEAWILHGLEPTPDGYHTTPNDRAWQGVLVYATPSGVTACRARVERSGWRSYFLNLLGSGWDYFLPTQVRGRCGRRSVTARTMSIPWPVFGGFSGGVQASSPLAAGNGWLEHRVPVLPNT
jgi:hypothetical protein